MLMFKLQNWSFQNFQIIKLIEKLWEKGFDELSIKTCKFMFFFLLNWRWLKIARTSLKNHLSTWDRHKSTVHQSESEWIRCCFFFRWKRSINSQKVDSLICFFFSFSFSFSLLLCCYESPPFPGWEYSNLCTIRCINVNTIAFCHSECMFYEPNRMWFSMVYKVENL